MSVFLQWDLRLLIPLLLLAFITVAIARLTWHETGKTWVYIGILIMIYALVTLLTGLPGISTQASERIAVQLLVPFQLFHWQPVLQITVGQVFLALSQFVRVLSIAAMTVLIPYTFDPAQYGITFRKLGMPDKIAFAMDLTMRFVPSLTRDFQMTMDAQKARGYELDRRENGLAGQVRKMVPLLVPVIVHSVVSGEEITDAMDLRAFGTRPRTWLRELRYQLHDYILIAFSVSLLLATLISSLMGYGVLWVP